MSDDTNDGVVELSHGDVIRETVMVMAERGYEPCLLVFHNATSEVEVFTKDVDLRPFLHWLLNHWLPGARDRTPEGERGH